MAFSHSLLVLSLFAAQGCLAKTFLESAAMTDAIAAHRAQEWMRMHAGQDPDQAGLDELKAANPDAYGIVQALLSKKSLGLLNYKDPAPHSFSNQAPQQYTGPRAVDVLRASEHSEPQSSSSAEEAPLAALSVSAPRVHRNWLNWRPSGDDDSMAADQQASTFPEQEAHKLSAVSLDWGNPYAGGAHSFPRAAKPAFENSYYSRLKGVETDRESSQPVASMSQENSYISSVGGLDAPFKPEAQGFAPRPNRLSSFSWSSDSDSTSSDAPKTDTGYLQQSIESKNAAPQPLISGALSNWLSK